MELAQNIPLDALLKFFNFEGTYVHHQAFGDGHIHDTFKITFTQENTTHHYLLQKFNTTVFQNLEAVMGNIAQVSNHLQEKFQGIEDGHRRYLRLISGKGGVPFLTTEDKFTWRAFDFIEHTYSPKAVESPKQAYQAAKAFGTFVRLLMDSPVQQYQETIPDFHHLEKRYLRFEKALQQAPQSLKVTAQSAITAAWAHKSLVREVADLLPKLPLRIVHQDTKITNVLLDAQSGEGICVVDLDTVMPGYLLYDYGDMVRTFVSPVPEDAPDTSQVCIRREIFEALSQGYLNELREYSTAEEKAHLFLGSKLMTYLMALRFLTDFLQGNPYYKIQHPRHNLDRSLNQFRLLEVLTQEEAELKKVLYRICS